MPGIPVHPSLFDQPCWSGRVWGREFFVTAAATNFAIDDHLAGTGHIAP